MQENLTRLTSGLLYVIILIMATSLSEGSFFLLFGVFMLGSVYEFSKLIHFSNRPAIALAITVFLLFLYIPKDYVFIPMMICLMTAFYGLYYLFTTKTVVFIPLQKAMLTLGYTVMPFILIIGFPAVFDVPRTTIIYFFILVWVNDTAAYLVGKSMGKRKLFEKVSPKKTVEGFLGGFLFCILAGVSIALYVLQEPIHFWIINAILIAIFGTLGDLVESKFKRQANVKDSGNIMPGHGGILDRLDSIIFAIPFIFLFYKTLSYVS